MTTVVTLEVAVNAVKLYCVRNVSVILSTLFVSVKVRFIIVTKQSVNASQSTSEISDTGLVLCCSRNGSKKHGVIMHNVMAIQE